MSRQKAGSAGVRANWAPPRPAQKLVPAAHFFLVGARPALIPPLLGVVRAGAGAGRWGPAVSKRVVAGGGAGPQQPRRPLSVPRLTVCAPARAREGCGWGQRQGPPVYTHVPLAAGWAAVRTQGGGAGAHRKGKKKGKRGECRCRRLTLSPCFCWDTARIRTAAARPFVDTMYNGVGLTTPRGSGTSGHVTTNSFNLRGGRGGGGGGRGGHGGDGRGRGRGGGGPPARARPADPAILEHNRRRAIEVKLAELADALEEQGYERRLEEAMHCVGVCLLFSVAHVPSLSPPLSLTQVLPGRH